MKLSDYYFLCLAGILFFFNGSGISFILFLESFGNFVGTTAFLLLSLFAVLLLSLIEDAARYIFYVKSLLIGNSFTIILPLYFLFWKALVFPQMFN